MTPERWQQIRDVLENALDLAPNERSDFLAQACSSDPSLRQEVETLLASSPDVHPSFLQSFTLRVTLTSGTKLGDYEVKSLLGSGGMGEVYRARDLRLGRDVAIKVLPSFLSADRERLRRFEQEARAAATLNHPNILAVHQLGTYEGAPYLVSELLEGETLREQIGRGRLSVRKTIDYGVQIARGLAAAHEKGIVHRDLKPENLFVTKDGRLKILDFGLAKLTQPSSLEHSAPTIGEVTQAGEVMGTVGYMSPEQVRGQTADHRADIFAFGAILYEMLTGKRAFQKPTSAETMTAILNEDPPGFSQVAVSVSPALERVVHRCLEKSPEQRFQSASDLAFALEASAANSDGGAVPLSSERGSPQGTSLEKRRRVAAITGAAVAVLAAASVALFFFPSPWRRNSAPSRNAWVQITHFADSATQPALSPDGHMIAFIRGPDTFVTPGQIYVKMLPDGEPVQLTHDDLPKMAPAFSPDGSRIAYTTTDRGFGWNTWVVPVLGGEPQKLLPNAAALTWADNQHVVFSEIKTGYHMGIATATESRVGERDVYLPANIYGMAHRSWVSPDGKWILVSEMDDDGWLPCRVLPFDGSTSGETAGPKAARCTYAGWSPDGRTMYFSADAGDGYHIWRQRFPGGVPEQMTFGATEEEGIAVSPNSRSLVTSAGIQESTVWLHDSRGDRQISGEGFANSPGLGYGRSANVDSAFSPNEKNLFYLVRKQGSRAFNSGELWMTDLDSGHTEAVLSGVLMSGFDISQDGERVVFDALDAEGNSHVWLAPLDRHAPPKQLTSSVAHHPSFGPGGAIYFAVHEGGQDFIYSVGPDDVVPRKMNPEPVADFIGVSPDGEWLLSGLNPVIVRPAQGGPSTRICSFCGAGWGPGGKLFYVRFREAGWMGGGKTIAIGLPAGKDLPVFPPSGLKSAEDLNGLNVVAVIDMTGKAAFAPGPDPSIYAYTRITVQRNLYRIPLN
jgi:eukaryotic-like serine/threonine-protein kinase